MGSGPVGIDVRFIVTDAVKDADRLDQGIRKAERSAERLEDAGKKAGRGVSRAFRGSGRIVGNFGGLVGKATRQLLAYAAATFGVAAAMSALRRVLRFVFEALDSFEQRLVSIQSLLAGRIVFDSDLARNFQLAEGAAKRVFVQLREIERRSPAAFDEIAAGYQNVIAFGGAELVRGLDEAIELTGILVTATNLYDRQTNQTLSNLTNIRAVLTGQVSQHALLAKLLQGQLGSMSEVVREARKHKNLLDVIKRVLPEIDQAGRKLGLTWRGIATSVKTIVQQLARLTFGGIFERLKNFVIRLREQFDRSKNSVVDFLLRARVALEALLDVLLALGRLLFANFFGGIFSSLFDISAQDKVRALTVVLIVLARVLNAIASALESAGSAIGSFLRNLIPASALESFQKVLKAIGNIAFIKDALAEADRRLQSARASIRGVGKDIQGIPRELPRDVDEQLKSLKKVADALRDTFRFRTGAPAEVFQLPELERRLTLIQNQLQFQQRRLPGLFDKNQFLDQISASLELLSKVQEQVRQSLSQITNDPEAVAGIQAQLVAIAELRKELLLLRDAAKLPKDQLVGFKIGLAEVKEGVIDLTSFLRTAVGEIGRAFGDLFSNLAQGKGLDALKQFFADVLGVLGDFAIQIGQYLLLMGLALQLGLGSLNPAAMIVFGIALIALGGVLKGLSQAANDGLGTRVGGGAGAAGTSPFNPVFVQTVSLAALPPSGFNNITAATTGLGGGGNLVLGTALAGVMASVARTVSLLEQRLRFVDPGQVVMTGLARSEGARQGVREVSFDQIEVGA